MHVYVWEHITKLGRDEVLRPGTCIKMFRPYLPRGGSMARPNRSPGGSPSSKKF